MLGKGVEGVKNGSKMSHLGGTEWLVGAKAKTEAQVYRQSS